MTYSFRLRLHLDSPGRIRAEGTEVVLSSSEGRTVRLKTALDVAFGQTSDVVVAGSGYLTEQEAHEAGERWQSAIVIGFAHNGISAALRLRDEPGGFTEAGLGLARQALAGKASAQVHNEVPGVQTFPTNPPAFFVSGHARGVVSPDPALLVESIQKAHELGIAATPGQLLAFEMYNASFAVDAPDVRLVCLMMSVEILIQQERRTEAEQAVVRAAIEQAKQLEIGAAERQSFVSSLARLLDESISAAGRRLTGSVSGMTYMGESAEEFFKKCYDMRSALVHGTSQRPEPFAVGVRAANLARFVGDVLSIPTLGIPPNRLPKTAAR